MAEVCAGQNLGADGFGLTRVIHANKDLVLRIPFTPFIPVKIFQSSPFLSWVPGRCLASVTAWFLILVIFPIHKKAPMERSMGAFGSIALD